MRVILKTREIDLTMTRIRECVKYIDSQHDIAPITLGEVRRLRSSVNVLYSAVNQLLKAGK